MVIMDTTATTMLRVLRKSVYREYGVRQSETAFERVVTAVTLVAVVTDTGIWQHEQPCFRMTERLRALCRAKRGKNFPPENCLRA